MVSAAWEALGQDPEMMAQRTRLALSSRSTPTAVGTTPFDPKKMAKIKNLVLTMHRQHLARSKASAIEMDRRSFLAHYKNVRGWKKKDRLAKWAEVENNPTVFRTSKRRGHLTVWVPQNPEVSIEELTVSDLADEGRVLGVSNEMGHNLLFGQDGGIALSSAPSAIVGGPSSLASDFDNLFGGPSSSGQAFHAGASRASERFTRSASRSDIVAESPGPSASEVVAQESDSGSESSDEDEESESEEAEAPPQVAPPPQVSVPLPQKRKREDEVDDRGSTVSSATKKSTKSAKKAKTKDTSLDWTPFGDTITKPLLLSEMKIMICDHIQYHVDNFEV